MNVPIVLLLFRLFTYNLNLKNGKHLGRDNPTGLPRLYDHPPFRFFTRLDFLDGFHLNSTTTRVLWVENRRNKKGLPFLHPNPSL